MIIFLRHSQFLVIKLFYRVKFRMVTRWNRLSYDNFILTHMVINDIKNNYVFVVIIRSSYNELSLLFDMLHALKSHSHTFNSHITILSIVIISSIFNKITQ